MKKQKKGSSVQDLLGIKTFTRYGLSTTSGELVFYLVSPTNISVLSCTNIEIKVRHLMMVLSAHPDIEIVCTDSRECFDDNKAFLVGRLHEEQNPQVRKLLKKDVDFLDHAQAEMSTARQFLFLISSEKRCHRTFRWRSTGSGRPQSMAILTQRSSCTATTAGACGLALWARSACSSSLPDHLKTGSRSTETTCGSKVPIENCFGKSRRSGRHTV